MCIDVEATCFEPKQPNEKNEIIEIGVTPIEISSRRLGDSRAIIVKNRETEISEFCTKLTTLTQKYIDEHGISYSDAMLLLEKGFRSRDAIFASWGDYDRNIIEKNCNWNNVRNPMGKQHINVKSLFGAFYGFTCGLDAAARHMNIPFSGVHHRGVDDSRVLAEIFKHLLTRA